MVVRTAILIVSDDALSAETVSAPLVDRLRQYLTDAILLHQQIIGGQRHWIEEILRRWCDEEEIDLILTVGGTFPAPGLSQAETVPEATSAVIERLTPALPELMRRRALAVNEDAVLDRGTAGIRGRTLVVNLPGDAALMPLFFDAGIDAVGRILLHLRPVSADGLSTAATARNEHKLDGAEFAEFLRRRGKNRLS